MSYINPSSVYSHKVSIEDILLYSLSLFYSGDTEKQAEFKFFYKNYSLSQYFDIKYGETAYLYETIHIKKNADYIKHAKEVDVYFEILDTIYLKLKACLELYDHLKLYTSYEGSIQFQELQNRREFLRSDFLLFFKHKGIHYINQNTSLYFDSEILDYLAAAITPTRLYTTRKNSFEEMYRFFKTHLIAEFGVDYQLSIKDIEFERDKFFSGKFNLLKKVKDALVLYTLPPEREEYEKFEKAFESMHSTD